MANGECRMPNAENAEWTNVENGECRKWRMPKMANGKPARR
jgi:hypothetical protein